MLQTTLFPIALLQGGWRQKLTGVTIEMHWASFATNAPLLYINVGEVGFPSSFNLQDGVTAH